MELDPICLLNFPYVQASIVICLEKIDYTSCGKGKRHGIMPAAISTSSPKFKVPSQNPAYVKLNYPFTVKNGEETSQWQKHQEAKTAMLFGYIICCYLYLYTRWLGSCYIYVRLLCFE